MTTVYVSPLNGDDTYTGLEQDKPVRTIARAREIAVKAKAEEICVFDGAFSSRLRVELEKETKKKRRSAKARITPSD